jgi:2-methylisocitrate lyase-like PEP mutase family enzyme
MAQRVKIPVVADGDTGHGDLHNVVRTVREFEAAGAAGVLLGDVLAAWDGTPLASVREMLARLDPESVGREVTLDLVRAGQRQRVPVRIRERAVA